jgi:hypothetical protein
VYGCASAISAGEEVEEEASAMMSIVCMYVCSSIEVSADNGDAIQL